MVKRMASATQPLSDILKGLPTVQSLDQAHDYLLQVLITRFSLQRQARPKGTRMEVCFDLTAHAIWNREGKRALREAIPRLAQKKQRYQKELDHFLIDGLGDSYDFKDEDDSFPFRYISGGTLPILRIGGKRFYCLFYREVDPIGWNIANGAADNLHELMDPRDTVRREFGEELLIVNPANKTRYVFEWATDELAEWPGFSVARRLFQQHYTDLNLGECREIRSSPKWEDGPDSLLVSCEGVETRLITGFFLNVNATDFGIEIDRVATIALPENVVVFDGEINGNVPVGAPIGLFPVEAFNQALRRGDTRFMPTHFFYDAKRYDNVGSQLSLVVKNTYIPRLLNNSVVSHEEARDWQAANSAGQAFDLCPVTRSLVQRYIQKPQPRGRMHFDFFLSWPQPDEELARQTYQYLTQKGLSVFFSAETPMTAKFGDDIRTAIHNSDGLVVLATDHDYLRRVGVMYEWVTFINDVDDHRKPKTAPLVNFASGFGYNELPTQLSMFHLINFDRRNMQPGLDALGKYIDRLKRRRAVYTE